jgi:hypothetical protein
MVIIVFFLVHRNKVTMKLLLDKGISLPFSSILLF